MAQYKLGTISITNGTNVVTGVSTQFLANVVVGNSFKVSGVNALYNVIAVDSDTQVRISPNYAGTTVSGAQYQISTSFTPNLNLAEIETGDSEFAFHLTHEVIRKLDAAIPDYTDALASKSPLAGPGSSQSFSVGALTATTLNGFATSQTPGANQILVTNASGALVVPGGAILGAHDGSDKTFVERFSGAAPYAYLSSGSADTDSSSGWVLQCRNSAGQLYNALQIDGRGDTATAPAIAVASTGKVGIGAVAPQAMLEVLGNTTVSGWSVTQVLNGNYAAGAGGLPGLLFQSNGTIQALIRTPNGGGLAFHYGTGLAEAMRITSAGNLLIGVTTANGSGASLQTKDGLTFPATQVASADPNTLDDYREASYTGTATGLTTAPTGIFTFVRAGGLVVMDIPTIIGESNSTAFTVTGMPTTCRPVSARRVVVRGQDNGVGIFGLVTIGADGVITMSPSPATGALFAASGSKGVAQTTVTYPI